MEKRIDFNGRLDGRTELGDGSVRFNARLTRTGVFQYGDHAELRRSEDVFDAASMASFAGIAATDGHRAFIDAENWREHSIGHVGDDVHQDGEFLVASIVVKDAATIGKIDRKELVELSMGYVVNLDATPGVTEDGEKYDSVQKDIRGNHAALGPLDWGRAGTSVRLLDGAAYGRDMTTDKRIDAPAAHDASDLAASRADADAVRKERDVARAERDAASKRADTAEAERDAAKKDVAQATSDAAEKAKSEASRVDERVTLLDSAKSILGTGTDLSGKTDREVRIAALTKVDPASTFDGKSDDYVTASFDIAVRSVKTDRTSLAELNVNARSAANVATKSALELAHERADADRARIYKDGAPEGATVRT